MHYRIHGSCAERRSTALRHVRTFSEEEERPQLRLRWRERSFSMSTASHCQCDATAIWSSASEGETRAVLRVTLPRVRAFHSPTRKYPTRPRHESSFPNIARAPSVAAAGRSWAPHDFNPPLDFPSSNNGTHRMCASELSLTALALSTLVQHVGPSSRGFDVTLHPRQKPSWWSVCIACLSRDICTASTVLAHRGTLCADECWLSSRTTLGVRST